MCGDRKDWLTGRLRGQPSMGWLCFGVEPLAHTGGSVSKCAESSEKSMFFMLIKVYREQNEKKNS
jgi:hypothetical protein